MQSDIQSPTEQPDEEFDQYVRYEDDDGTVICDRRNAAAWIRSTVVRPCRR